MDWEKVTSKRASKQANEAELGQKDSPPLLDE